MPIYGPSHIRQGNQNEEVAIYRYVTEGSFDAYIWQALETKAKFIAQVMTGDSTVRRAEDIGGQELSYAEVKAIASGNPAVLTLAEADADLQRLTLLHKHHADEQYLARRKLKELPGDIARLERRIATLTEDMVTAQAHARDPLTIGGRLCDREEALERLATRLESLPTLVSETHQVPLGVCRGLRFSLVLHPRGAPEIAVEGETTRFAPLSREFHGPRAILNAVERVIESYESECATARKNLAIAQDQLRDYEARLGAPFAHDAYLIQLTTLRNQLEAALAGKTPEPGAAPLPTAGDVVAQLKTLKAAHTIEPTPERTSAPRTISLEEPVTTRLRHRKHELLLMPMAAEPVAEKQTEPEAAPEQTPEAVLESHDLPPVSLPAPSPRPTSLAFKPPVQTTLLVVTPSRTRRAPAIPAPSHQEHLARQHKVKEQLTLF